MIREIIIMALNRKAVSEAIGDQRLPIKYLFSVDVLIFRAATPSDPIPSL